MSELGLANALWYAASICCNRTRGALRVDRFLLVAQPVPSGSLLPPRRGRSFVVRRLEPGDGAFDGLLIDPEVQAFRFAQGCLCLGLFKDDTSVGCLWLRLGAFHEDVVRCRFKPLPSGASSWDLDLYILPEYRSGLAFARLWDEGNTCLRDRGVAWSFSRISAFNRQSWASHAALGARRLGMATFVRVGDWQILMSGLRPYFHISRRASDIPTLVLEAPK